MNLHEYQGKEMLESFGVAIQKGIVADSPEKALLKSRPTLTLTYHFIERLTNFLFNRGRLSSVPKSSQASAGRARTDPAS